MATAPSRVGLKKVETKHLICVWWDKSGARRAHPTPGNKKYFVVKGDYNLSPFGREETLSFYSFKNEALEVEKMKEVATKVEGTLVQCLKVRMHFAKKPEKA